MMGLIVHGSAACRRSEHELSGLGGAVVAVSPLWRGMLLLLRLLWPLLRGA